MSRAVGVRMSTPVNERPDRLRRGRVSRALGKREPVPLPSSARRNAYGSPCVFPPAGLSGPMAESGAAIA